MIDERTRQAVHDRVGKHERRSDVTVAFLGQRHGRLEVRGGDHDGKDLTIQVIDDGGRERKADHQPTQAERVRLQDCLIPRATVRFAGHRGFFGNARRAPPEMPPSISKVWAVTYSLASEARKTMAPSKSPGWPGRFSGMRSQR